MVARIGEKLEMVRKHIFHSDISVGSFGVLFTRTFHLFGIFQLVEEAFSYHLYFECF